MFVTLALSLLLPVSLFSIVPSPSPARIQAHDSLHAPVPASSAASAAVPIDVFPTRSALVPCPPYAPTPAADLLVYLSLSLTMSLCFPLRVSLIITFSLHLHPHLHLYLPLHLHSRMFHFSVPALAPAPSTTSATSPIWYLPLPFVLT